MGIEKLLNEEFAKTYVWSIIVCFCECARNVSIVLIRENCKFVSPSFSFYGSFKFRKH